MTRILVQRGGLSGSGSSSNQSRNSSLPASSSSSSTSPSSVPAPLPKDEEKEKEELVVVVQDTGILDEHHSEGEDNTLKKDELFGEKNVNEGGKGGCGDKGDSGVVVKELGGLRIRDEGPSVGGFQIVMGSLGSPPPPPPPPVPPPKLAVPANLSSRSVNRGGVPNGLRIGGSRRAVAWPVVSAGSRPSSPRSYGEGEGYNSADEQNSCYGASYDDAERERQFEHDIRRAKGFEVKRMLEDGNCLFRAVADQVYGDTEAYDLTRQMCIDYMARERDHFSQFITEGFTSYCKRKRRDKVYGNNVEIQALCEMYNRPIHIYSYSIEPINIFHGTYNTDTPPIRLSFHHGNHYNSLVDPRRLSIGAGLGFSSLQGANIDRDQVKAAIKAQQEQQIDNALLAEGRFNSDLELTEKEMERMVMEASRAEYLADEKFKQQVGFRESSTSKAEPSSSGAIIGSSRSVSKVESGREKILPDTVLSSSMQMVLSMGFSYMQVVEAYSIFGDDVDSIVCYLLETGSSRRKGKSTE